MALILAEKDIFKKIPAFIMIKLRSTIKELYSKVYIYLDPMNSRMISKHLFPIFKHILRNPHGLTQNKSS
jgi:hypothetical protein